MSNPIVSFDERAVKDELRELVGKTIEEAINAMLDEEADQLVGAAPHERTEERAAYRAGHYERGFTTTSGQVTVKMPTCFLEFEPPDFCNSFRLSSTMNRLRKAAFKPNSKSSHWDRFPMRRFFASTSTHTQTQRFSETANLSESRGFKASTSNTGLARS